MKSAATKGVKRRGGVKVHERRKGFRRKPGQIGTQHPKAQGN